MAGVTRGVEVCTRACATWLSVPNTEKYFMHSKDGGKREGFQKFFFEVSMLKWWVVFVMKYSQDVSSSPHEPLLYHVVFVHNCICVDVKNISPSFLLISRMMIDG